ncbi:CheR family methyltransferase [Zooshikella sp. RANM57]|uniref:CheR family methyltransferase n=1 Tax=Zooshikella sp. RANM57 TaxID=3425863 RepID=UPI003D6EDEC2
MEYRLRPPHPAVLQQQLRFTTQDFYLLKQKAKNTLGISLTDDTFDLVYQRLASRIKQLKLKSFNSYYKHIEKNKEEIYRLINALTSTSSVFFDSKPLFEILKNNLLPTLLFDNAFHNLRIWSIGCGFGTEPYSISICLYEQLPEPIYQRCQIIATDVNYFSINEAKRAVFDEECLINLSTKQKKLFFFKGIGHQESMYRVKPLIKQRIVFHTVNLTGHWPFLSPMDIIVCRQQFVFFDQQNKQQLLSKLLTLLNPGGYLIMDNHELQSILEKLNSSNTFFHSSNCQQISESILQKKS